MSRNENVPGTGRRGLLHDHGSQGSALTFLVLSREELAKALWLYDASATGWSSHADTVELPESFELNALQHRAKLAEATIYDTRLELFWGKYPPVPEAFLSGDPDAIAEHLTNA